MSALDDIKARAEGHTQGPLIVDDEEQTVRVGYAGEIMFDRSGESRSYWARECRPNAELFAAAPKLLAALEAVEAGMVGLDEIFAGDSEDDEAIRAITAGLRAAINEALEGAA